jgi:hypothetical protein
MRKMKRYEKKLERLSWMIGMRISKFENNFKKRLRWGGNVREKREIKKWSIIWTINKKLKWAMDFVKKTEISIYSDLILRPSFLFCISSWENKN